MSTLSEEKKQIVNRLTSVAIEPAEAACEAEIIMQHVLGLTRAEQILHASQTLNEDKLGQIEVIVVERERRVPLQQCLGFAWFMGRTFKVKPGVFIPRTDTETLVETVQEALRPFGSSGITLAEIGVGSGVIAISLLSALPNLKIIGCDLSPIALEVSRENARCHGVIDRLTLIEGDWRQCLPDDLDGIVSNPPYVPLSQRDMLQPEVRDHDPPLALFGSDDDGAGFYRELAGVGRDHLRNGSGFVAVEVGDGQADLVAAEFIRQKWCHPTVYKDVNGLTRVVLTRSQ
jgi:release factor glutamine methyltransferase